MAKEAYYCTVKELNKLGRDAIPAQLRSNTHLIYSSPATLAFNSPGAEGFGVKRAGLAVPDSIMLIVAPGCCGRNTSLISSMREYDNRFFYLMMDLRNSVWFGTKKLSTKGKLNLKRRCFLLIQGIKGSEKGWMLI